MHSCTKAALLLSTTLSQVSAFTPTPYLPRAKTGIATPSIQGQSLTALQGSLVDRFFRVSKANLNTALQKFEDPEKIILQAMTDMQSDLVKVRQQYADVTATQRRLAQQKVQLEATADGWYTRAQLAIKSRKEDLAREALRRRETLLDQANSIQMQMDTQAPSIDRLYEGMRSLEDKRIQG